MIKLVAIDLDDTLLDSKLSISPPTVDAIRQAIKAGVMVTLATGRMYQSALPYALELGLDVPLVTYHGALVKTSKTRETLYHKTVSVQLAKQVIQAAEARGFTGINLYMNDEVYVGNNNTTIMEYSQMARVDYTRVEDLPGVLTTGADKIMVIDAEAKLDALAPVLRDMVGERLHITKSKPHFLEITHPEATKGHALEFLAGRLGISRAEIMAVGDSYNDLEMLEFAGLGVAMGNARPAVKERADFVTLANDAHGVAEAIRKFVLAEHVPDSGE
ncbi:MAG TPA: Cof-type HAD-IIB family hydrolase [Verrucomicrobiae bacterium]|nr:Cof-type HAD-IIB family hydrolase [Verrucomicrobiae bacterium]